MHTTYQEVAKKLMKITEINIVRVKPNNGLIGFVSFIYDDRIYIGNIAIFSRRDGEGIRLVYPTKQSMDCVHPISKEIGDLFTYAVEKEYNKLISDYQC